MFSRAERFADKVSEVPPCELPHVKWSDAYRGGYFDKSDRFKGTESADGNYSYSDESLHKSFTSKKTSVTKEPQNGCTKGPKKVPPADLGKVMELEKEIKRLLAERADLNKQLVASKGEIMKLEGKLQMVAKDKSGLLAQVASLNKERLDLTRAKKILQAKVDADCDVKRPAVLQTQLDQTEKKLNDRNREFEIVKSQLAELTRRSQEELRKTKEANTKLTCEISMRTDRLSQSEDAYLGIQQELEAEREMRKKEMVKLTDQFQEDLRKKEEVNMELSHDLSRKTDQLSRSENACLESQQEWEAEREARKKEMAELTKKYQEDLMMEKNLSMQLTQDLSTKTDQLAQSENAYRGIQQEVLALKEARRDIENRLSLKVDELEEEARGLSEEASRVQMELETERETKTQLQKEIKLQSDQIVGLEKESSEKVKLAEERLVVETATLDAKLTQKINYVDKLEKDLESLTNSAVCMKEDLSMERKAKDELEKSLTQRLRLVSRLEAEITTANENTRLCREELEVQRMKAEGVIQNHVEKLEQEAEELTETRRSLDEEISQSRTAMDTLRAELQSEHQRDVEALTKKCLAYEDELANQKERTIQQEHQKTLESLTNKCLTFEEELTRQRVANHESETLLRSQIQAMEASNNEQRKDVETHCKIHSDLLARITELEEENERLREENKQLQRSYEEIEERYRPYKDQIDGLEGINLLLQNQTSLAQSEAQKLSEQYARLLGHQNQKQKIQHVKKLKDENANLKQENAKLKTEVVRLKKRLEDGGGTVVPVSVLTKSKKKPSSGPPPKPLGPRN